MRFASGTSVPVERSRMEIERTLARYGADQFAYMASTGKAVVAFRMKDRGIRFDVPLPTADQFAETPAGRLRSDQQQQDHCAQATRQRWRALLLAIKAKLEAVESGIATFEDEFLAYFVMANGQTVGSMIRPQLDGATKRKAGHLLLTGPGDS